MVLVGGASVASGHRWKLEVQLKRFLSRRPTPGRIPAQVEHAAVFHSVSDFVSGITVSRWSVGKSYQSLKASQTVETSPSSRPHLSHFLMLNRREMQLCLFACLFVLSLLF